MKLTLCDKQQGHVNQLDFLGKNRTVNNTTHVLSYDIYYV